jgi:hypothetical protein
MRVLTAIAVLAGGCDFAAESSAAPDGRADSGAQLAPHRGSPFQLAWADAGVACLIGCGDGTCDTTENCRACQSDCGACAICGDGECQVIEDATTCPTDCGPPPPNHCGNGSCGGNESCRDCATDCGPCPACGDGHCDRAEACTLDCGPPDCD